GVTLTVNPAGNPGPVAGNFEGFLDVLSCDNIYGWVWDRDKPNTVLNVEYLEGATIETATVIGSDAADIFRQDLLNNGKGNGVHGYNIPLPESLKNNQPRNIWVRVQGGTYILKGSPKTITCPGSGTPTNQPP
ncbi:hypothetical protein, partial [Larkinella soli]|uniref:hypothetical protein n=1 Tax=Larkinella soli TaxID=1770527 RepID=UPI0019D24680